MASIQSIHSASSCPLWSSSSAQRGHEPEFVHSCRFAIVLHHPLRILSRTPRCHHLNQTRTKPERCSVIFVRELYLRTRPRAFLPPLLWRVSTNSHQLTSAGIIN
ncbi:hypothetical protein VN97_g7037 [Penicillium thymicola]|uniref:Uncharacterized protein n=1 Tax=Penicillium thymicola TaxID=293382 RepID=A0AAI9TGG3_PENTH|nr:hypothetical protein VN97_g7037 [Penicillium thymicola]